MFSRKAFKASMVLSWKFKKIDKVGTPNSYDSFLLWITWNPLLTIGIYSSRFLFFLFLFQTLMVRISSFPDVKGKLQKLFIM